MSDNGSIVPAQLNPELSAQLRQEVDFFLKWGYLVVEDALTEEEVDSEEEADQTVMPQLKNTPNHNQVLISWDKLCVIKVL